MTDRDADDAAADAALRAALARLVEPLARLAVARGVPFPVFDELLRAAVVAQAHAVHPGLPEHRRTSRVSAATGLNRREVDRLLQAQRTPAREAAPPRSPAAMVFARWRSDAAYRTKAGAPRVLPRSGPAPSFESLAQAVTRDVHPRALLEELLRLKLATHDTARDRVALAQADFVPRGDSERMLQWLGANVGDHLAGAVDNVLAAEPRHADQAVAADGLRAASVAELKPLLHAHWQRLAAEMVPLIESLIARDQTRASPEDPNRYRLRFGIYGYDDTPPPAAPAPAPDPSRKTRK
jgi:Family of unknown function (DUF6502)